MATVIRQTRPRLARNFVDEWAREQQRLRLRRRVAARRQGGRWQRFVRRLVGGGA